MSFLSLIPKGKVPKLCINSLNFSSLSLCVKKGHYDRYLEVLYTAVAHHVKVTSNRFAVVKADVPQVLDHSIPQTFAGLANVSRATGVAQDAINNVPFGARGSHDGFLGEWELHLRMRVEVSAGVASASSTTHHAAICSGSHATVDQDVAQALVTSPGNHRWFRKDITELII